MTIRWDKAAGCVAGLLAYVAMVVVAAMRGMVGILVPVFGVAALGIGLFCLMNVGWHCWQGMGKRAAYWRDRFPGHEHESIRVWVLALVDLTARFGSGLVFLGFAYAGFFLVKS